MATVTEPIALDKSINTTEVSPRNIADVLAEELARIAENILPPNAEDIAYDNSASGLTATNVQDAIDEIISSQSEVIADTMADLTENKTATVTDGVADFETIDGSLVKSLVVEIEPSQSGSGTPSPSNIRPITGWTQEDVEVAGKNRCTRDTSANIYNAEHLIPVKNGDTVYCYFEYSSTQSGKMYGAFTTNKEETNKNNTTNLGNFDSGTVKSYTMTADGYFCVCYALGVATYTVDKAMISTSPITAYEPYHGKTYTTPFNQTVYGGTLDALTGELTIDRVICTASDFSAEGTSAGGLKYRNYDPTNFVNTPSLMMCNVLPYIEGGAAWSGSTPCYTSNTTSLRVYYETGTWGDYSNIQILYPLATPTTLSLTPQTVKSLVGENHIQASTGDVLQCKYSMIINGDDLAQLL